MLDTKIGELTASINTLIEVMRAPKADAPQETAKAKPTKPKEVKKEEPKKEKPEAPSGDTFEDVKKAILALAKQEGGRDKVIGILGEFNAEKASEVSESDYASMLDKLKEAADA